MKKYKVILMTFLAALTLSCEDEDKIALQVENLETGSFIRTLEVVNSGLDLFNLESTAYELVVEVSDTEDGDLLESVDIFSSFRDVSDRDNDISEEFVRSIPASEFTTNEESGLPMTDLSISAQEMASAMGLDLDDVGPGDQFRIRLAVNTTDGKTFTSTNSGGNVSGLFYSSPFRYIGTVVCPPFPPTSGEWTIEMQDSYGDGWNNAALVVTIDGTTSSYTMDSGSTKTVNFNVPSGAEVISIQFQSGDWDSEITFQITSANGNEVVNLGPNPPANRELLDYCEQNL